MNRSSPGKKGRKERHHRAPRGQDLARGSTQLKGGLGKGTVMCLIPILLIVVGVYELVELTAVACPLTVISCVT